MQTFVTYKKHGKTATALDTPRLGKQRAEAIQILSHLVDDGPKVGNPYAYSMWEGWEAHLAFYGMLMAHEWGVVRRYRDDTSEKFKGYIERIGGDYLTPPPWLGDLWVLRSHRSNLVRKLPHHYGPLFSPTPEDMPYLWPINVGPDAYSLKVSNADGERLRNGERILPPELVLAPGGIVTVA